ncbi:hypothetical protein C8E02_1402 [Vogesella indigofera]|uniref:Uncharacterized protein n=1 Tax=Vogesella indigofera TaxID=45465 RepID=A0A495BGW2_VOGIN|nr:hypothetical protein [Vogesella indigofera]RKQ60058.1 hypothetical protein C8E02_1402 [Vogesella indigofera]
MSNDYEDDEYDEVYEDWKEEERREEEEARYENECMDNDPYSDDEKANMGSSEFFYDND